VPGSEAPAAPKRSHKKKVAPEPKDLNVLEQNITTVGNAAFGMVGLATGSPHIWTLYPGEMEGVAAPAARIIDRAGATESTNKYTDYIMLFGAVALIVLPRIMEMRKMKPLPVIKEEANVPTRETKGSNGQVVQPDPGTISSDRPNLPEYLYDNN
jgi:hypothetical protein